MTRLELLQLAVARARSNGFEFRRWYTSRLALPWISTDAALTLLDTQRRYYALLFSHEFASNFWKTGVDITFEVPAQNFQRLMPDGTMRTVARKPFIRRSSRRDVWRYHLREMALADEPLRYLRKYMHIEEQLDSEPATSAKRGRKSNPSNPDIPTQRPSRAASKKTAVPRPLPKEPPAFLKRPYKGLSPR